jgi:hypothetical protein
VNLTIKKIISEFGIFGLIRLPLIFASIKIHNIKIRFYRKDVSKLNRDIKKIKELTVKDFQLFPNKEGEDYKKVLKWSLKNAKKKTIYSLVKEYYGSLPFNLSDDEIKGIKESIPNNNEDGYYRSHSLNKGKNDQWEYYLVPWHRLLPFMTYFFWDERFKEHFYPIYQKYKKWYKEFIWYNWISTGSNIYAVNTGLAIHCLNEYLLDGNTKSLKKYKKHLLRLKYFMKHAFENGIPMEGCIYARFIIHSVYHIDQIHRHFGLEFKLIDDKFVDEFADYLESAWTVTDGFETSGDSHWEIDKLQDTDSFIYLSKISDRQIYKDILEHYAVSDYYYNPFYLS